MIIKNSVIILMAFLVSIMLTFFIGCNLEKKIVQQPNHWIIFEYNDARKIDDSLSWDFGVKRAGNYDVQIMYKGNVSAPLSELDVRVAGMQFNSVPEKISVIEDDGKKFTVFQFIQGLKINEPGNYSVAVKATAPFSSMRIVPTYRMKLGFSSGTYDKQWLAMHNSPEKQATLDWFKQAKYGMFIHWGIYSQAGGIWDGKTMEQGPFPGPHVSEWLMYKFRISRKEYERLADDFNPDTAFATQIAKLAKAAGMKYVIMTSKHHDGFAMFDSKCSDFDIVDRTPFKADAIKMLYDACLEEGLKFGVYYSHGNDWYDGTDGNYANVKKINDSLGLKSKPVGKNLWDPSPNTFDEYLNKKSYPQIQELLDLMPELSIIWFDGEGNITEEQSFKFYKMIYDHNPGIIVNRRVGFSFADYLDAGDNVIPSTSDELEKYWETCGTTNNSWAFKSYDDDWKSTKEVLYYLVDIASKGGNYLLNIGPDGKGHVPAPSSSVLREMGGWLKINGDAIYGTSRWVIPSEGKEAFRLAGTGHRASHGFSRTFTPEEFWFTAKGDTVYAISLVKPAGEIKIKSLNRAVGEIEHVSLLGNSSKVKWKQSEKTLLVDLPGAPENNNGYALKVTFKK